MHEISHLSPNNGKNATKWEIFHLVMQYLAAHVITSGSPFANSTARNKYYQKSASSHDPRYTSRLKKQEPWIRWNPPINMQGIKALRTFLILRDIIAQKEHLAWQKKKPF